MVAVNAKKITVLMLRISLALRDLSANAIDAANDLLTAGLVTNMVAMRNSMRFDAPVKLDSILLVA